ncbi:MAG: SPASM domain-containing protein [Deltaproteobacteria bacterium]
MGVSNEGDVIKNNVISFFERDYPLIKLFKFGNEILLYDAKPHLVFIISKEEIDVLIDFLSGKPETEVINIHSRRLSGEYVKQLLTKYEELKNNGVFIKGPVDQISPLNRDEIEEQLKYYDENILLRKFCLEVTEDCNYRCTYCKRTIAKGYKGHSKNHLSAENARQGINYYFKKYTGFFNKLSKDKKKLLLEILPPSLSFYGGEPFLNFELIKKSAAYFKSLPWHEYSISPGDLKFSSNTNLSIMTNQILGFLTENRVHLFASLDGPAEEHDKCRVFKDGAGTFEVAYGNLLKIRNFSEAYFKERVTILGVYTSKHNRGQCVDFTRNIGALGCEHFPAEYVGSFVPNVELALADFNDSREKRWADFQEKAAAESKNQDIKIEYFAHLLPFAKLNYDHPAGKNSLQIMLTCPMGFDNLMLAASGEFLICHKVDDSMPIGDCEFGLDFETLIDLNQRYNTAINNNECKNCWIVNFCSVCAATRMARNGFINPTKRECDYFRQRLFYDFSCFVHLALEHPALLQKIFDYRNDISKYIGIIDINEF